MSSIPLRSFKDISDFARSNQWVPDNRPVYFRSALQHTADSLSRIAKEFPLQQKQKFESQIERIVMTRAMIQEMGIGVLAFSAQMKEIENLVAPYLGRSAENREMVQMLGEFYHKFFSALKESYYLTPRDVEVRFVGNDECLIATYIACIKKLLERLPPDEKGTLTNNWAHFMRFYETDPKEALWKLKILIDSLKVSDEPDDEPLTDDQKRQLEDVAGSLDTDMLRTLLVSLPIYDLMEAEKVTILKRAIDQPNLAPLATLLRHDCFNELDPESFDELIAYAQFKKAIGHAALLQSCSEPS